MWGLLAFFIGGLYGWMTPGVQNKTRILWTGLLIGIVVGLTLGLFGAFIGASPLGIGTGVTDTVLSILVITLLFVVGVWVGDMLQRRQTVSD